MLYCTRFFSNLSYSAFISSYDIIGIIATFGLALYLLPFIVKKHTGYILKKNVNLVVLSFVLSAIPAYILYNQSFYYSLVRGLPLFLNGLLLYYLLAKWRIREDFVCKAIIGISVAFTTIEILQQFTYPIYWFNGRAVSEYSGLLEQRMGLWRFYVWGINYCVLGFFILFQQCINQINLKKNIFLFIYTFLGIVFFVARKNIFAAIGCIVIGVVFSRQKGSIYSKIMIGAIIVAAIFTLPIFMSELLEQTQNELGEDNEDFIRFIAADYFINEMNDSPLYVLMGAGMPSGNSLLEKLILSLQENYKIYQDDCGFIGYYSRFGLLGLGTMILLLLRIIVNYKYIDLYLLLFLLFQLSISFFDFFGNNTRNLAAWAVYLYLIECSIKRNKAMNLKIHN